MLHAVQKSSAEGRSWQQNGLLIKLDQPAMLCLVLTGPSQVLDGNACHPTAQASRWHSSTAGCWMPACSWCACQAYCQKDPALQSIAEESQGWVLGFPAYERLQEFLLKMEGAFKQHIVWTSASEDHQSQAVEVSCSAVL